MSQCKSLQNTYRNATPHVTKKLSKRNSDHYVADGFKEDCAKFMEYYLGVQDLSFEAFIKSWKEFKMSMVFLGRLSVAELVEFTEEAILIVKKLYFLNNYYDFEKQLFGLFLLYALYYMQPCDNYAKIKVINTETKILVTFKKKLTSEKRLDALYILCKMLSEGAFQFCLSERDYGAEKAYRKYFEGRFPILPITQRPKSNLGDILGESRVAPGSSKQPDNERLTIDLMDDKYDLASLQLKLNKYHEVKKRLSASQGNELNENLNIVDDKAGEKLEKLLKSLSVVKESSNSESVRRNLKKKAFTSIAEPTSEKYRREFKRNSTSQNDATPADTENSDTKKDAHKLQLFDYLSSDSDA